MEQKISIISFIKASLVQKKPDMILQFLAVSERGIKRSITSFSSVVSSYGFFQSIVGKYVSVSGYSFPSGSVIIPFSDRSYEANNAFPYGILCAGGSAAPPA